MKTKVGKESVRNEERNHRNIANEIVQLLVTEYGRFGILAASHRGEFYNANSLWFPLLTNILLSIRPWFYLHMATETRDARRLST